MKYNTYTEKFPNRNIWQFSCITQVLTLPSRVCQRTRPLLTTAQNLTVSSFLLFLILVPPIGAFLNTGAEFCLSLNSTVVALCSTHPLVSGFFHLALCCGSLTCAAIQYSIVWIHYKLLIYCWWTLGCGQGLTAVNIRSRVSLHARAHTHIRLHLGVGQSVHLFNFGS